MEKQKKKKKIEKQIVSMSVVCILAAVALMGGAAYIGMNSLTTSILKSDTDTAYGVLSTKIAAMKRDAAEAATDISGNLNLKAPVQSKDRMGAINAVQSALQSQNASFDFEVITDANGAIIGRTDSEKSGDSIADQPDIKSARQGKVQACFIQTGGGTLILSAAAPIKDNLGKPIGYLSVGYSLDNSRLLDNMKAGNGCEYSIFYNNVRINTTLVRNGQRMLRSTLDPGIANLVLKHNGSYTGEIKILGTDYYSHCEPILGPDGKAVGAFYTGKPIDEVGRLKLTFTLGALLIAILITSVSIFIFTRFSKKKIVRPIQQMSAVAAKLSDGDLSQPELNADSDNEIGILAESLKAMSATLRSYVMDISHHLNLMSAGDMTGDITLKYIGDFEPIRESLETISRSLNETLSSIGRSAQQVNGSARQVSAGSQALAQGTTEQAGSIEELSASILDVSARVEETSKRIESVTGSITSAVDHVGGMNSQMEKLVAAMNGIRDSSDRIEQIIQSIDDIAFQTNILALNAAVEAARAGEAGKGFAVVADEVRNLAAKSAEASKETAVLIQDTLVKVHNGFVLTDQAAKSSQDIFEKLQSVTSDVNEIDRAAEAEASAIAQIKAGISHVSTVVQTNSATAEESAAASEELSGQADLLRGEVGKFRLC